MLWFQVEFNGFSLVQVSFSWFQVGFYDFHGSIWVFMVFMVPGFFMVSGHFLWVFKVPGWFFMVENAPKGIRLICILAP